VRFNISPQKYCHWSVVFAGALLVLGGCANYAKNAPLYQQNVALHNTIVSLKEKLRRKLLEVHELEQQLAAKTPSLPTLSANRLRQLFTVQRIRIGADTRIARLHGARKPCGFRVFVRTLMAGNIPLPATGTFTIEAFDLALVHGSQRIGQWTFTPAEAKKAWYGMLGLNQFAFDCPWKKPPQHDEITFHVRFVDALTGRVFTAQRVIHAHK
jgi:hypothetical protein